MAKKKITALLSLLVLPNIFTVISCGKKSVDQEVLTNSDENNNIKIKNATNILKNDEEMKKNNAQISKIKLILDQGIDGSKDFTPSQSLAEPSVTKKIIEKIKKLCGNPEHINFTPQVKSQYFKAGSENYVDVKITYTKKDFEKSEIYHKLQIKNVKQDLQELVNKALEDLKNLIDFSKSFLIEHDDFNYDDIEKEFIKVLYNQLEQEDERLSIKLVDKDQDLKNDQEIEVEVIGKDDNEEIIKTTQVTPINLYNVQQYINDLKKHIFITRDDKLFVKSRYTPLYTKKEVNDKIKTKFNQSNADQLRRRELDQFELDFNPKNGFRKGQNYLSTSIQLKYNKSQPHKNSYLILLNIENHPEFILNKVADRFETNGLDLLTKPIFDDSDFEKEDVKGKIVEIMRTEKHQDDEKNDIAIKINYFDDLNKFYYVTFSHSTPEIIDNYWVSKTCKAVKLKDIQKSPSNDLKDFINILNINKPVQIDPKHFNDLHNKYKQYDNLNNSNLNSSLENCIRTELVFENLPEQGIYGVKMTPQQIVQINPTFIKVEYKFEFGKSGKTAFHIENITFTK